MDDAEYKKLWAKIDAAHIRIGRLEGEREMLIKTIDKLLDVDIKNPFNVDIKIARDRAKRLLETMKGE